jgi:hypothetical protein
MADNRFRQDLYYRLNVFPISVPPLRERQRDIPELVDYFVQRSVHEFGARNLRVAPETIAILMRYHWPGNVRELQHVIERSVLMTDGDTLLPCDLPPDMTADLNGTPESPNASTLYGQEKALILKTLQEQNWNQSQTARTLGITRVSASTGFTNPCCPICCPPLPPGGPPSGRRGSRYRALLTHYIRTIYAQPRNAIGQLDDRVEPVQRPAFAGSAARSLGFGRGGGR